jgi:hypothetical protein
MSKSSVGVREREKCLLIQPQLEDSRKKVRVRELVVMVIFRGMMIRREIHLTIDMLVDVFVVAVVATTIMTIVAWRREGNEVGDHETMSEIVAIVDTIVPDQHRHHHHHHLTLHHPIPPTPPHHRGRILDRRIIGVVGIGVVVLARRMIESQPDKITVAIVIVLIVIALLNRTGIMVRGRGEGMMKECTTREEIVGPFILRTSIVLQ